MLNSHFSSLRTFIMMVPYVDGHQNYKGDYIIKRKSCTHKDSDLIKFEVGSKNVNFLKAPQVIPMISQV